MSKPKQRINPILRLLGKLFYRYVTIFPKTFLYIISKIGIFSDDFRTGL